MPSRSPNPPPDEVGKGPAQRGCSGQLDWKTALVDPLLGLRTHAAARPARDPAQVRSGQECKQTISAALEMQSVGGVNHHAANVLQQAKPCQLLHTVLQSRLPQGTPLPQTHVTHSGTVSTTAALPLFSMQHSSI